MNNRSINESKNIFKLLKIAPTNQYNVVRQAYLKAMIETHPDKTKNLSEPEQKAGVERFRLIQAEWIKIPGPDELDDYLKHCQESSVPNAEPRIVSLAQMTLKDNALTATDVMVEVFIPMYVMKGNVKEPFYGSDEWHKYQSDPQRGGALVANKFIIESLVINANQIRYNDENESRYVQSQSQAQAQAQAQSQSVNSTDSSVTTSDLAIEDLITDIASQLNQKYGAAIVPRQVAFDAKNAISMVNQHSYWKSYDHGYFLVKVIIPLKDIDAGASEIELQEKAGFKSTLNARSDQFFSIKSGTKFTTKQIREISVSEMLTSGVSRELNVLRNEIESVHVKLSIGGSSNNKVNQAEYEGFHNLKLLLLDKDFWSDKVKLASTEIPKFNRELVQAMGNCLMTTSFRNLQNAIKLKKQTDNNLGFFAKARKHFVRHPFNTTLRDAVLQAHNFQTLSANLMPLLIADSENKQLSSSLIVRAIEDKKEDVMHLESNNINIK